MSVKNTLLIGRGGRIIDVIGWTRSIELTYFRHGGTGVVFPLEFHDDEAVHSATQSFQVPSVLMLLGKRDKHPNYDRLNLTRKNVFIRDGHTCQWCGKKVSMTSGTVDHVFPVSRGGTNTWRNVVACCPACNNEKGNKTGPEYTAATDRKLTKKPHVPGRGLLFRAFLKNDAYASWHPYIEKQM